MKSATKIAVASLAMLLLGSSATMAQPYGYGRYGYAPRAKIGANGPPAGYCGPLDTNVVDWIIDPASGRPIERSEYLARYPWSNPYTWIYDCNTGLWTDHTADQNPGYYTQSQNYDRGRGYERHWDRYRGYERDRDRD